MRFVGQLRRMLPVPVLAGGGTKGHGWICVSDDEVGNRVNVCILVEGLTM